MPGWSEGPLFGAVEFSEICELTATHALYIHNIYIKLYLYSNFRVANRLISSSWHYIKIIQKIYIYIYTYTLNAL